MLSNQKKKILEQANFTYSPLGKAFQKQRKTIEEQGKKQINAITNQNERSVKWWNEARRSKKVAECV